MRKSTGGNARPPLQVVADFVFHGDGRALSPAEKVTAFAIASHTNRRSGRTDPSDERIAHVSGLDVKTVWRAVKKLGGLYSFQRGGSERGARRRATTYTLRATPDTTPPVRLSDPGHSVKRPRTFTPLDPGHHAFVTKEGTKEGNQGGEPRGSLLDEIPCPSCSRAGHLSNSLGRNGHPPGFWCRRPGGCGMNFGLDADVIVSQMTPGARRAIQAQAVKVTGSAPIESLAGEAAAILERDGMILGRQHDAARS